MATPGRGQFGDINQPGFASSRKEPVDNTPAQNETEESTAKVMEYSFDKVRIVEPDQGFRTDHPFMVSGSIRRKNNKKPVEHQKVLVDILTRYKGKTDIMFNTSGVEAFIKDNEFFEAKIQKLIDPKAYTYEENRPADATYTMWAVARNNWADNQGQSAEVTLPAASTWVDLKKGHYDKEGADKLDKPTDNEWYLDSEVVLQLQQDLKQIGCFKDNTTGYFGDKTEAALNEFIKHAIDKPRMKRKLNEIFIDQVVLANKQPDGILDENTRKELTRWLMYGYVIPKPVLRENDIDEVAVREGIQPKKDACNHKTTPIKDNQEYLSKIEAYPGKMDGWFGGKMKDAVSKFQEWAERGQFIINGRLTDIGEKLTGHKKGSLGPETQKFIQKVVEKNGKVAKGLTIEEKMKIIRLIASFESGATPYTACNKDYEFEGRFDLPSGWYKDKTKAKPDQTNPNVTYSKYSENPRHVGLSFGLIQFTQEGPLGVLLKKMNEKLPEKYKEIFGTHHKELLEILLKTGDFGLHEEELFDNTGASMGKKKVKRRPSIKAVGGYELWENFWVEKFKASGNIKEFQECQEELASTAYMDPFIKEASGLHLSQKTISILYDRSVNSGPNKAKQLIAELRGTTDEKKFWQEYVSNQKDFIKKRVQHLIDVQEVKWEVVYEL